MADWRTKIANALGVKTLEQRAMRFPTSSMVFFDFDRPTVEDLSNEIGDGTSSDVLMTPIRWIQRSIVEAPLVEVDEEGAPSPGELQELLDRPNDFYSTEALLAATVFSLATSGNAYWLPTTDGNGRIVELWYVPHFAVKPRWPDEGDEFISRYEYTAGGNTIKLDPDEVIHFRDGIDPQNMRLGLSPIRGLLREIWTDNEASMFTAALLKNGGVPGLMLSPDTKDGSITPEEAQQAEDRIDAKLTRTGRGRMIVMGGATKLEQFGYSPQQLDLSPLRNVSEERVCAALGVQPDVVGFGTGLQQTRIGAVATENTRRSWTSGVIPLQRIIAGEIGRNLAEDLGAVGAAFDNSQVESLRENEDGRSRRIVEQWRSGLITRATAKTELGYEPDQGDEVYHLSIGSVLMPAGSNPTAMNGNGQDDSEEARTHIEALLKGQHQAVEERLAESAPTVKPPAQIERFAKRMDRLRVRATEIFAEQVAPVFSALGREVERLYVETVASLGLEQRAASEGETKQTAEEEIVARTIIQEINFEKTREELAEAYAAGYSAIMGEVVGTLSTTLGIEILLPDPVQLEILREGGTRAGLIDLEKQTREAIFEALETGREQGLAGDNLARFIREKVEAGPWPDAATRAKVIARTEGAFAANTSVIRAARSMEGVEMMMIHDNRSGFGDDICTALDGKVVTIAEAEALMAAEHPQGTRSASPLPPLLLEEMGL